MIEDGKIESNEITEPCLEEKEFWCKMSDRASFLYYFLIVVLFWVLITCVFVLVFVCKNMSVMDNLEGFFNIVSKYF